MRRIDLKGQRFGRLTVLEFDHFGGIGNQSLENLRPRKE